MIEIPVALIGALVGTSELLARYTDSPWNSLRVGSSIIYILINAAVSLIALYVVEAYELVTCAKSVCTSGEMLQLIFIAGFGGMVVMRASISTIKVQGQDVGVGPAAILQIYLNVTDRATDRRRAKERAAQVASMVKDIDFQKAKTALPAACFALMQNIGAEEQEVLSRQVVDLDDSNELADAVKMTILALAVLDIVGENALLATIAMLKDDIKKDESASV